MFLLLRRTNLAKAAWAGLLSGLIIGLFMKAVEALTTLKVYTLLLNIDYIPLLNKMELSEFIEFILHLIVSLLLSIVLAVYLQSRTLTPRQTIRLAITVGLVVGAVLFPTTVLSERTPALTDIPAFLLWLAGHGLYGWTLGVLLSNKRPR